MSGVNPFEILPEYGAAMEALGWTSLQACLDYTAGEVVKAALPGRDIFRARTGDRWYYLKRVSGRGWRDVVIEYRALKALREAGVPVPDPVAMGTADRSGAMVSVGLPTVTTLEHVLLEQEVSPERLRRLAERVAHVLRTMHGRGVNHRDFYACHILLDEQDGVYLVDLGRAEIRARVPRRRIIKDLAGLHFSLPERVAGNRARLRFLLKYLGPGASRGRIKRLVAAVRRKSARIRNHSLRKISRGEPNVHVNE